MKVYLAVNMTDDHNYRLAMKIIRYLRGRGHQVLDDHVGYKNALRRLEANIGRVIRNKPRQIMENIIRDQDFAWIEEADATVFLLFGPGQGVYIEYSYLLTLLRLSRLGKLKEPVKKPKLILCLFLENSRRSAIVHGLDGAENQYVKRGFVPQPEVALTIIRRYL